MTETSLCHPYPHWNFTGFSRMSSWWKGRKGLCDLPRLTSKYISAVKIKVESLELATHVAETTMGGATVTAGRYRRAYTWSAPVLQRSDVLVTICLFRHVIITPPPLQPQGKSQQQPELHGSEHSVRCRSSNPLIEPHEQVHDRNVSWPEIRRPSW